MNETRSVYFEFTLANHCTENAVLQNRSNMDVNHMRCRFDPAQKLFEFAFFKSNFLLKQCGLH